MATREVRWFAAQEMAPSSPQELQAGPRARVTEKNRRDTRMLLLTSTGFIKSCPKNNNRYLFYSRIACSISHLFIVFLQFQIYKKTHQIIEVSRSEKYTVEK